MAAIAILPIPGMPADFGHVAEPTTCNNARINLLKLFVTALLALLIVAILTGCEGEGGAYCAMFGHPRPWSALYKIHEGEYGDLVFATIQLLLMLALVSFDCARQGVRDTRFRGFSGTP
jgi:hypothetical protein